MNIKIGLILTGIVTSALLVGLFLTGAPVPAILAAPLVALIIGLVLSVRFAHVSPKINIVPYDRSTDFNTPEFFDMAFQKLSKSPSTKQVRWKDVPLTDLEKEDLFDEAESRLGQLQWIVPNLKEMDLYQWMTKTNEVMCQALTHSNAFNDHRILKIRSQINVVANHRFRGWLESQTPGEPWTIKNVGGESCPLEESHVTQLITELTQNPPSSLDIKGYEFNSLQLIKLIAWMEETSKDSSKTLPRITIDVNQTDKDEHFIEKKCRKINQSHPDHLILRRHNADSQSDDHQAATVVLTSPGN